ncbi:MAG: hypothetical protein JST92_08195, partial [Deltaproteobacteria bacterium]|nr:hypothetical protein [Deltaproteobacteria bacterium]
MNVTRLQVENLHRDMVFASNEAAKARREVDALHAKGGNIAHLLRPWRDSTRVLADALRTSAVKLAKDGNEGHLVARIEERINDLSSRAHSLDLERELDETVKSFEALATELIALRGLRGNYLVSLLWSKKPDIDRATMHLSKARANGGFDEESFSKLKILSKNADDKQKT